MGHSIQDIRRYSLRQMNAFQILGAERKRIDLMSLASVVRVAQHAELKEFQKFLGELENGS